MTKIKTFIRTGIKLDQRGILSIYAIDIDAMPAEAYEMRKCVPMADEKCKYF
jgi:hypothetical protein